MANSVKNLQGTPWHLETMTRAEDDPRRHRVYCIYYKKDGYCKHRLELCSGSAHCDYYVDQREKDSEENAAHKQSKPLYEPKIVKTSTRTPLDKGIVVGTRVVHKNFGEGVVKKIDFQEKSISVRFFKYYYEEKKFDFFDVVDKETVVEKDYHKTK